MRTAPLVSGLASAIVVSAFLVACDRGPTTPGIPAPAANNAIGVALEIVGPRSVAPGETVQLSMILRLSNGSTQDVTNETTWQTRAPQVLAVGTTGAVTGLQVGDANIFGSSPRQGALTAIKELIVVPAGTYRLTGIVNEAGVPTTPVRGARVDVASGANGPFTTTGDDGRYRLYGVSGDTQLRITKTGYDMTTLNVLVTDHAIQNFEVRLSTPRIEVAGTYTLTIAAADSCRGKLPDEALLRTYTAVVTQQGPRLETTLTGGSFANNRTGRGSSFPGSVEPSLVRFSLNLTPWYNYYPYVPGYYPDIVEQLSSGYFVVSGSVGAEPSRSGFAGLLDGDIALWPRDPRGGSSQSPTASCRSGSHRFTLSR